MTLATDSSLAGPGRQVDVAAATHALAKSMAIALVATAALIAVVLAMLGQAEWWRGFAVASVLGVLAAICSVATMRLGLAFGVQGAMAGHFGGVLLRLLIVLGGGLLLVWVGGYPTAPTLALAVPYYFATLAAEVVAMAKVFWSLDSARGGRSSVR